jgi:four helix bundle protein
MLSFQRLDVYQRAIEFVALVTELAEQSPRGHSERIDQLVRSAESVPRNIAEAAGRWSPADVAKHYKIARGEAMESVASLDILAATTTATTAASTSTSPTTTTSTSTTTSTLTREGVYRPAACSAFDTPCIALASSG